MTNVAQHAYPDPQKDIDIYQAWWMSGSFDTQTRLLTVMFYDQGVTIPASLPQSKLWGAIKGMINPGSTDGEQISAAFEVGRSRTKEAHRGKGVAQLLHPLHVCSRGALRIISRRGVYVSNCENGQMECEVSNTKSALEGTFIEWKLYLAKGDVHECVEN